MFGNSGVRRGKYRYLLAFSFFLQQRRLRNRITRHFGTVHHFKASRVL